ncbi:hypothetical protein BT63DRAFT_411218 [Microthyrium microscopicum]|uniref:Uncharacterized protein n=1 Tax=Microthyrium microscopicum TaxID=703497 RepID=A0A6A6UJC5_9PEZI|nr:hypothetical protein BT63DRAFT_411218 [Microthyrium microscopicum]
MPNANATNGNPPNLPSNVLLFTPTTQQTAHSLLNGSVFTRLAASGQTEPAQLAEALRSVDESFCLCHRNVILIFDSDAEGKDVQDAHHEHFRVVCLALKDKDINLNVAGCVHDASTALEAGFQLDELNSTSVLVIDLMAEDGEE